MTNTTEPHPDAIEAAAETIYRYLCKSEPSEWRWLVGGKGKPPWRLADPLHVHQCRALASLAMAAIEPHRPKVVRIPHYGKLPNPS